MIKITIPFDFAYAGIRVVKLKLGEVLPDEDEAARYAVREGLAESCEDEEETASVPDWPLQTPPDVYLEKTPNGPKADLARQIIGS